MQSQNNAPSTYFNSEYEYSFNKELNDNFIDISNLDFFNKNELNDTNINLNINENHFLDKINIEDTFEFDKKDLSIFHKDSSNNNSVPLPLNCDLNDKEQAPKIANLNSTFDNIQNTLSNFETKEINMGCPQNVAINDSNNNNQNLNLNEKDNYFYSETPGNFDIDIDNDFEKKSYCIFDDSISTPHIDNKNNGNNLLMECPIDIKNEQEIASMINNVLNTSQAAPLTIEKNNINNIDIISTSNQTEKSMTNIDKKCNITKKDKKIKMKKKRKYKPDGIRKKIKSRTHKNIKKILNLKLSNNNSKMLFDYLPQIFISDVTIEPNKKILNLSLEELYLYDFGGKQPDKEKLATNKKVINYLNNNPLISQNSGINILLKCSYRKILSEYFNSDLLKKDLENLRREGEDEEYIQLYQYHALNFVSFYENNGKIITIE